MSDNKELIINENTGLMLTESMSTLVAHLPEHKEMIEAVKALLPEVQRASSLFFKRQSQFMDNMMTISHPTPLRNLRQILAEMNSTREALKVNYFKLQKSEIKIKLKEEELGREDHPLKKELISIRIKELEYGLQDARGYVSGAIRKLANYTEQYKSILSQMGVADFNELDYEKEEERYHVMKAFEQASCAARAHGGIIDEGNMIYFTQIGINGGSAQKDLFGYLTEEGKIIASGGSPTHEMFLEFLSKMADKYKGSANKLAEHRGMKTIITEHAALKHGDTRLLLAETTNK